MHFSHFATRKLLLKGKLSDFMLQHTMSKYQYLLVHKSAINMQTDLYSNTIQISELYPAVHTRIYVDA